MQASAAGCTEPCRQIADKYQTVRASLELLCARGAERDTARREQRNPAQKPAQDASAGIEIHGFANGPRLYAPHCKTGSHALCEPDHQKPEHNQSDEHLEQSEAALPPGHPWLESQGVTRHSSWC
jgi:hypothetical protein